MSRVIIFIRIIEAALQSSVMAYAPPSRRTRKLEKIVLLRDTYKILALTFLWKSWWNKNHHELQI